MNTVTSDTPFFSIVVPTYNSAKCIRTILASIVCQEFPGYEIVIQDGLSTDATISLIEDFRSSHPLIPVKVVSEKDLGIYDAMNKAIDRCTGKYLLFLGSDDELYNSKVLLSVYEKIHNTGAEMVYGNVQMMGDVGWSKSGSIYAGEFTKEKLFYENICHQAIFYNRNIFDTIGKFHIKYKICADWDMNHRCFAKSKTIYIPDVIARFYAGGESSKRSHDTFTDHDIVINLHRYYNISYFNKLFKDYVWVFLNVSNQQWTNRKYFRSLFYFFVALYHSPSKVKTIRNYLVNIRIILKSRSVKSLTIF